MMRSHADLSKVDRASLLAEDYLDKYIWREAAREQK